MTKQPISSPFAIKLKELRKQRKITMKKLADKLDVSESFISRLESGQRSPSKPFILELGKVLFPEGNTEKIDDLLIMADFTPTNLDSFTGKNNLLDIFQESLDKDPNNFRAFISLILSLIKQGKYALAREKIDTGMQQFDDSVQLQSLLSALELAKGNYNEAIQFQRAALEQFESEFHVKSKHLSKEDLLLNLGIFHFIYGHELVIQSYDESKPEKELKALKKQAKSTLQEAQKVFQEALKISPNDIYILDEYARVNFNLTYLAKTNKEKKQAYKDTIEAYRQIVFSPRKRLLNYQDLIESTVFLGYAYAKNEQYEEAEYHMNVVESCLPNYWLIHYIKACLYTLEYEKLKKENLLDEALDSLEAAVLIDDSNNSSRSEALADPDLKTLRTERIEQFAKIVKQGAES